MELLYSRLRPSALLTDLWITPWSIRRENSHSICQWSSSCGKLGDAWTIGQCLSLIVYCVLLSPTGLSNWSGCQVGAIFRLRVLRFSNQSWQLCARRPRHSPPPLIFQSTVACLKYGPCIPFTVDQLASLCLIAIAGSRSQPTALSGFWSTANELI